MLDTFFVEIVPKFPRVRPSLATARAGVRHRPLVLDISLTHECVTLASRRPARYGKTPPQRWRTDAGAGRCRCYGPGPGSGPVGGGIDSTPAAAVAAAD